MKFLLEFIEYRAFSPLRRLRGFILFFTERETHGTPSDLNDTIGTSKVQFFLNIDKKTDIFLEKAAALTLF
jgi:hypothetical protein